MLFSSFFSLFFSPPFRIRISGVANTEEEEEARAVRGREEGKKKAPTHCTQHSYVRGVESFGNIHASSGCMALMLGRLPAK